MNRNFYQTWDDLEKKPTSSASMEEKLEFALNCGILAASIHNTQPWQFAITNNSVHVTIDWSRHLPLADPTTRNIYMSLGTCVANITMAAKGVGLAVEIKFTKDAEEQHTHVVLEMSQNSDKSSGELDLSNYITKRFSNKFEYDGKNISEEVLVAANKIYTNDAQVNLFQDSKKIEAIASIVEQTTRNFSKIPGFNLELANWLKLNNESSSDGMPGFVVGLTDEEAVELSEQIRSNPSWLEGLGKIDGKVLRSSPAVGVITIKESNQLNWIQAGMTYQKLALYLTSQGINLTPMQAIIEHEPSYNSLCDVLDFQNDASIFFRVGYAENKPYHTPRRPLEEFLLKK